MYYVAKVYKSSGMCPNIVEQFDKQEDAVDYASIMNRSGKGEYIVLTKL